MDETGFRISVSCAQDCRILSALAGLPVIDAGRGSKTLKRLACLSDRDQRRIPIIADVKAKFTKLSDSTEKVILRDATSR
jgi:pyrimidine operon attenuation protein/uracil phosphoribosyltransferase